MAEKSKTRMILTIFSALAIGVALYAVYPTRTVISGIASNCMEGPVIESEKGLIWIDVGPTPGWSASMAGQNVTVTGRFWHRFDRPVYVQKPGDLPRQGIPVDSWLQYFVQRWRKVLVVE